MTTTLPRPIEADASAPDSAEHGAMQPEVGTRLSAGGTIRPMLAAGLASSAAALTMAGIFGTWSARILAVACVAVGSAWQVAAMRVGKRSAILQALLLPATLLVAAFAIAPHPPADVLRLIGDAVAKGRLLRPPVPFDPGWRALLIVLITVLAHGNAAIATSIRRPRLALVLPVPIIFVTAITQPKQDEALAGIIIFLFMLAALAVLFGGDLADTTRITRGFEIKRAIRGVGLGAVALLVLVGLNSSSFLFPKPSYNPAQKPQKPKAIPLSEARDRVLFEVQADAPPKGINGPWRMGTLDVYDGRSWRLAPLNDSRLVTVKSGAALNSADSSAGPASVAVTFTVRDLGKSPQMPTVTEPRSVDFSSGRLQYDPRTQSLRVTTGTVPAGMNYVMHKAPYPDAKGLAETTFASKAKFKDFLEIPSPPPAVRDLLASAPTNPWDRLDFFRGKLNAVVVAVGPGLPKDVPAAKVQDLLVGSHEGSPFEIVAAEAMLARWAGVPSRIGFGFEGFNDEAGKKTVRPKNGANWLEAYFDGYGWVPIVGSPPRAKTSLDTDPNTKFDPTIKPSDDVAIELYLAVRVRTFKQLYEQVRAVLLTALPIVASAILIWLSVPIVRRWWRRRRQRVWAARIGPRAQIATHYAELRDYATDLNIGDPFDTALEYLDRLEEDDEHQELAWLVTRTLYGDLGGRVGEPDVEAARAMVASLKQRMAEGQTRQARIIAFLSKASLRAPYAQDIAAASRRRVERGRLSLRTESMRR